MFDGMPKLLPMNKYLLLLCLLAAPCLAWCNPTDTLPSFLRDSLEGYVTKALTDWQIPGIAVCVVKEGKVVVMKWYGLRELGTSDKVDTNTLFMIGSNTKAFTATALAMLNADKKLSLDDLVTKWL